MEENTVINKLEEIDGVESVRKQSPYFVILREHGDLSNVEVLNSVINGKYDFEEITKKLPAWTEYEFSNSLELFVTVDEETYELLNN